MKKPAQPNGCGFSLRRLVKIGSIGVSAWKASHIAWRRFLALTRLSLRAVCEESIKLGCYDYHTYTDDIDAALWHTRGGASCKRCGKQFRL